jgi:hypothetical protein
MRSGGVATGAIVARPERPDGVASLGGDEREGTTGRERLRARAVRLRARDASETPSVVRGHGLTLRTHG